MSDKTKTKTKTLIYKAAANARTVREFEAACRGLGLKPQQYRGPESPARQIYAEVKAKQEQRRANRPGEWNPNIRARMRRHLLEMAAQETRRRGLATLLVPDTLIDYDPKARVWLVGAAARVGSKSNNWWYDHRWVVGRDGGRLWAIRVPRTVNTVEEALRFLEPAEVRRAREEGRGLLRQGDIYFIEMRRRGYENLTALEGTRHTYDPATRTVTHPEHKPVRIPPEWPGVKAVRQRTLGPWQRHQSPGRVFGD